MSRWLTWLRGGAIGGHIASALSTLVIAGFGLWERRNAVEPINEISHWAWGDHGAHETRATLKQTAVGMAIHHVSSLLWSTVYDWRWGESARRGDAARALRGAMTTAALAYVVDYFVVPPRFDPGFHKRLSRRALAAVYVSFGVGLALPALFRRANMARARGASQAAARARGLL